MEVVLNLDDDLAAAPLPPLPTFRSGGMLVDISDREALFETFDSD